jgi:hypothetical protein
MAEGFQKRGKLGAPRVIDSRDDGIEPERPGRVVMQRGVSQLLFNYLPARTVDWEDGLAIVMLEGVELSQAWDADRSSAVLEEISLYFDRWKSRGGTIDPFFPDPKTDRTRYTIGLPQAIEATVLNTALYCPRCFRLSFPKRQVLARLERGELQCIACGKKGLRQVPHVFVHGCGELVPVSEWIPATRLGADGVVEAVKRPLRCPRCGVDGPLVMSLKSERVKDMKIVCQKCEAVVVDRLTARCHRCLSASLRSKSGSRTVTSEAGGESGREETIVTRIAMRVSRYSASDTYYAQTLSMLRLDRPATINATDEEQSLLRRMLPVRVRPGVGQQSADTLATIVQRLRVAEAEGNHEETERLRKLIVQAATSSSPIVSESADENLVPESSDLLKSLRESLAFRQTVSTKPATAVAREGGGANEFLLKEIEEKRRRLGLRELLLVEDLPVITASFGYTRRSFEPTYPELSAKNLPTQIRAFPSLQRAAAQRIGRPETFGTVPILAREGEHEGIFLSLEPERVASWLRTNGVELPNPELPTIARILKPLEPIDTYYDDVWNCRTRRLVFGLVHSLAHIAMRAVSRFAGLERTSLGEYIFLPLLGAVVFDNSGAFRLGGIETLARDQLSAFLSAFASEAVTCLYDAACLDHSGACHGCIHSPEISCRFFNHGLSRAFLVGGHTPWADAASDSRLVGYWSAESAS